MRLETNVASPPKNFPGRFYPAALPLLEVDLDEPVLYMQENYAAGPGGIGEHRYLVMYIAVADIPMAFWTDLGPLENFKLKIDDDEYVIQPFNQLVVSEHSVSECLHMAEQARDDTWPLELLHNQVHNSTLFEDYRRMIEEDLELVKNRSVFGPDVRVQRNEYSAAAIREKQYKEQNNGQ